MAIVELLLSKGADPNWGISGAAELGHLAIVELLLEKGASLKPLEKEVFLNLGIEGAAMGGHLAIVKLLLSKGADPKLGIVIATQQGHLDIIDYIWDTYF
jgi:ankyrin repeat protein